jgi:hypothetical protein
MQLVHIALAAQPMIHDFESPHFHVPAWMRSSIDQVSLVIVRSFVGLLGTCPVDFFRSWSILPWPLAF